MRFVDLPDAMKAGTNVSNLEVRARKSDVTGHHGIFDHKCHLAFINL